MPILNKNYKFSLLSVFMFSVGFALQTSAADYYQIVDLGNLGGDSTEGFSINNAGDVVGNASGTDFADHAYVYRNQQITDLGFLPYSSDNINGNSFAFAINNNNLAAGYSTETVLDAEDKEIFLNFGVYYDTDTLTVNRIPQFAPSDQKESRAFAINDNNIVVGFGFYDPPDDVGTNGDPVSIIYNRGFFYDIDNNLLSLVDPIDTANQDSLQNLVLRSININNYAVGVSAQTVDSKLANQVVGVDLASPNQVQIIEIFGGSQQQPWSINDAGKFVGRALTSDNQRFEAFIYDLATSEATGLGVLNESSAYSEAFDINESDQVVGTSQTEGSPSILHAFLYENSTLKDLDSLIGCDTGWRLNEARSINNSGVITGSGILNGERRAFMLLPIAGTAPDCSETIETDTGGGSLPPFGIFLMAIVGLFSRAKKR